jgi:hypothetical protein
MVNYESIMKVNMSSALKTVLHNSRWDADLSTGPDDKVPSYENIFCFKEYLIYS